MFLGSVALLSVLIAALLRKPLGSLVERRFHRVEILVLAVVVHLVFVPPALSPLLDGAPIPGLPPLGGLLYILSLSLLVVFAWFNQGIPGVLLILTGLLMNTLVIASNGGQMPVNPAQLAAKNGLQPLLEAEKAGRWSTFTVAKADTRLPFLGDCLSFPRPFMDPVILSIGDVEIAVGIFICFLVIPEAARQRSSFSPPELIALSQEVR